MNLTRHTTGFSSKVGQASGLSPAAVAFHGGGKAQKRGRATAPVFFQPSAFSLQPSLRSAFTILELLVVIAIIGIMASLAVPAIKNLGKSNVRLGAARQLLDDIGRARQLALSQRTTVYMVFIPTNFWDITMYGYAPGVPTTSVFSNLCADQLTGYTFITLRSVGDQPGQGTPNYLAGWQTLPDNNFIALWKFNVRNSPPTNFSDQVAQPPRYYTIYGFDRLTNSMPFPSAHYTDTTTHLPCSVSGLPYIAFNYLGQLTSGQDEYIPLAAGNMYAPTYGDSKIYQVGVSPTVTEIPAGNSYGSSYNVIHINWLTGRARQENQQVQ